MPADDHLPVALRNAIATATLAALDDRGNVALLDVLASVLSGGTSRLPAGVASRLGHPAVFHVEPADDGALVTLVLDGAFVHYRHGALERVERGRDAVRAFWRSVPATAATDAVGRALEQAAALWNAGLFYEVHEVLEREWRIIAPGAVRELLQGVIQIAAGFHHLQTARPASMRTLVAAGCARLAPHAPSFRGVDVAALLDHVRRFVEEAPDAAPAPAFPAWPRDVRARRGAG